jgi:hypothetical protein
VTPLECPREHEVVSVVLSNRWPEGCDEELRIHASACEVCRDAVTVAIVLQEDAQEARRDVHVPAAGQVWWRSAIRARVEAVQAAERPMTWLHGLAGACAVGLAAALLSVAWPSIESAAAWLAAQSWSVAPSTAETGQLLVSTLQRNLPVALVLAACAILAPIAIYLASKEGG